MNCKYCLKPCVKYGFQANGKQKLKCKQCGTIQQNEYSSKACERKTWLEFVRFWDMGSGVRKAAGFMKISINTYQTWVLKAEQLTAEPCIENDEWDMDELQTPIVKRNNKCWISYSFSRKTRRVFTLHLGRRSSEELSVIVLPVLDSNPSKIRTDRWPSYRKLIPEQIHVRGRRKANMIERKHLDLRKDIAYLIRESPCFAKSERHLLARLKWYFWGEQNPYFFLKKHHLFLA